MYISVYLIYKCLEQGISQASKLSVICNITVLYWGLGIAQQQKQLHCKLEACSIPTAEV